MRRLEPSIKQEQILPTRISLKPVSACSNFDLLWVFYWMDEMKLYCDEGRFCVDCDEFKEWSEFGKKAKSVMGYQAKCKRCMSISRGSEYRGDNNLHKDADLLIDRFNKRRLKKNEKDIMRVFKSFYMLKESEFINCVSCKTKKNINEFELISEPRRCHNGRRKTCNTCFKEKTWCSSHNQEKRKKKCGNNSFSYACGKCEYEKKKNTRENKIKEAIRLTGDSSDKFNGFVYLYRCDELDCFKIGITKSDPREYVVGKSNEYGIKLDLLAFISSPIRAYDAEWLATKAYKGKIVEHIKPCGGKARELFRCGFIDALRRLKGISKYMYLVDNPFVSLDDIDAVELDTMSIDKINKQKESIRRNDVIARKILMAQAKNKQWCIKNGNGVNRSSCCCAQIFDKRYINECKNSKLLKAIKEGRDRKSVKSD